MPNRELGASSPAESVIFGGSGFIGTHLANYLVQIGRAVVVADLEPPRTKSEQVRFVKCDVRQEIAPDLADHPTEVYNLAAVHRVPGHEDWEYFETNVPGAENVTDYCRRAGVNRLIFTSSISVYGPSEEPLNEDSPLQPTTAYGKSKLEAERIHQAWADEDPARKLITTRPGVIFGPGEGGNFTRLAGALRKGTFVYPGRRDAVKACAHVDELIRSMQFAATIDLNAFTYNCCYPQSYTTEDICRAFADVAGYKPPKVTVPGPPMMLAGWIFEQLDTAGLVKGIGRDRIKKLMQSTHILPNRLVSASYDFETDIEEGLRRWKAALPTDEFV